jgi:uncharacterized DUF497 family protein
LKITFDPPKRQAALSERGLDFADAELVFAGLTLDHDAITKNRIMISSL